MASRKMADAPFITHPLLFGRRSQGYAMCVIHMLLGRFNVTGDALECCSLCPPPAHQLDNSQTFAYLGLDVASRARIFFPLLLLCLGDASRMGIFMLTRHWR